MRGMIPAGTGSWQKSMPFSAHSGTMFSLVLPPLHEHMSSFYTTDALAERLGTLIEALPDAIFFKDGEGRWRVVNAAGLRLFGLAGQDWEGKTDRELGALHPALAEAFEACHRDDEAAWAQRTRHDTLEEVPDPDTAELHTFEVTKIPLFYGNGERRGLVVIGRDITARKRMEENELRQRTSLRHLNEIAALSHLPLAEQFKQALMVGAAHLGLEFGIVSHIVEDTYHIVSQVSPPDTLQDGQTFPFGQTYCSMTIARNDVLAIDDMGHSPHMGHPCYQAFQLEAYIGAPIRLDGEIYGTVNFSSPHPYRRPFDEGDKEFVQLLARWVESAMERSRVERQLIDSELQLRTIIEYEPECVKMLAADGTLLQMNRAGLNMIDADAPEQVIGKSVIDIVTPEFRKPFRALTKQVFEGQPGRLEFQIRSLKGVHRWLETNAVPLTDSQGDIVSLLGVTRDISERKQAETALRESEKRFRDTLEYAPIGMSITSLGGHIILANRALCHLLGYDKATLETMAFRDFTHPEDLAQSAANMERVLAGEIDSYQMEKRYLHKNGQAVWVQLTASLLKDTEGAPINFIAQVEDISERKRDQEQIRQLAYYDTLTNLPNRRLLMDRFNQALSQAKRFQRSLAVMFIDLDRFKAINDQLGHDIGDELLKVVAARLNTCVRTGDTVSRQGGDEFIVILTEIKHPEDAERVARKILDALALSVAVGEHRLHITTSIGIAVFPVDGTEDARELMKKADMAMYEAKDAGRNQYRLCCCPTGYEGARCVHGGGNGPSGQA